MADWCTKDAHPVIWSATQKYDDLPLRMPRLCSAERIATSMVDEIFSRRPHEPNDEISLALSGGGR